MRKADRARPAGRRALGSIGAAILVGALALASPMGWTEAAAEEPYKLIRLKGSVMKWGVPKLGTGATVRYAFVTHGTAHPEARNCRAMKPIRGFLQATGIAADVFRRETEAAFALWSAAVNIRFERVADPARADILIGAQAQPRGRAWANVDFKAAPGARIGALRRSLICLNPAQKWKVGFDGDLSVYDIRYTLAHEIGHAIGLDHPGADGSLMGYRYDEKVHGLQPGDIAGAALLYGARRVIDTVGGRTSRNRNGDKANPAVTDTGQPQ